jgi:hypothetical protein
LSAGAPRKWSEIETLMREESVLEKFVLPEIDTLVK